MKTAADWEKEIQEKTTEIHQKYPELIKYLSEMPMPISDKENPESLVESLATYYASLNDLIKRYVETQQIKKQ